MSRASEYWIYQQEQPFDNRVRVGRAFIEPPAYRPVIKQVFEPEVKETEEEHDRLQDEYIAWAQAKDKATTDSQ